MFARDVDRRIHRRVPQRLQQQAGLAAGAAAVVDDIGARPGERGNLGAAGAQERDLDARDVVLGHLEDGLEQVRAALVVDEAAGQPLRRLRQAGEHGLPEIVRRRRKVVELQGGHLSASPPSLVLGRSTGEPMTGGCELTTNH
jgi:hypothetical protein